MDDAAFGAGVAEVTELRVALTVPDFERALAFYRDALGLEQLADWSSESGRVVLLDAGRATLELLDEAQAETVDRIEAGARVSGSGSAGARSDRQRVDRPPARCGRGRGGGAAGDHALGRSQRTRSGSRRNAADAVRQPEHAVAASVPCSHPDCHSWTVVHVPISGP